MSNRNLPENFDFEEAEMLNDVFDTTEREIVLKYYPNATIEKIREIIKIMTAKYYQEFKYADEQYPYFDYLNEELEKKTRYNKKR